MQAARILATKPGGLTLSEAAAVNLPCVLFDAIPGPETENARHFVEQGAAVNTINAAQTADEILRLLADATERNLLAINAGKLSAPDATRKIVDLIADTLENSSAAAPILQSAERPAMR